MHSKRSGAARPQRLLDPAGESLTSLSLSELLQRLAACEEALRADPWTVLEPAAQEPPERQALLEAQTEVTRELRRRRLLRRQEGGQGVERQPAPAGPLQRW
jgi:hypothetical protein